METRTFILKELDCANCAAKIENDINKLDGVDASVNVATKIMTLNMELTKVESTITAAKKIISKYEPDVVVVEQDNRSVVNQIVDFEGLSCASCAIKIENEVSRLEGVRSVNVDFVTQKLTMSTHEGIDLDRKSVV